MAFDHEPVLLREVLEHVLTDPGGLYLDATLGLGGHTRGMLEKISAQGKVLGIDIDSEALYEAGLRLNAQPGQLRTVCANFRSLDQILESEKFFPLAGAIFDLGVCSLHFDKAERGFSFKREGPLDMRLSHENPLTAGAIVNHWPPEQLAMLIKEFGEEPAAERIARAIANRRTSRPFETTTDLALLIEGMLPRKGIHPATRTFMALRIAVNSELENLTRGLESVIPYLQRGGRVGVISFHSLEDKIVKNIFSSFVSQGTCRYAEGVGKSPKGPSKSEAESNPRARSAKLRILEKL